MGDVGQIAPIRFHPKNTASIADAIRPANVVINLMGKHHATKNYSLADGNVGTAKAVASAFAGEQGRLPAETRPLFIHISHISASPSSPSPFLRAKAAAEQTVRDLVPDAAIVRLSTLFSDEDRFLNTWGYLAARYPLFPSINGDRRVAPLSSFAAAEAIVKVALLGERARGATFDVAGPQELTMTEVEDMIRDYVKIHHPRIPLPPRLAAIVGAGFGNTRRPIITRDEAEHQFWQDELVRPDAVNTATTLDLEPITLDSVALNTLRKFRKPLHLYDVAEEKKGARV
jgi:NADH dehydrogenase (ubiquinone) 1 alpha subcomplex subunit 9